MNIDHFIVDFCCPFKRLIIEVDGGIHEQQREYDQLRTEILEERGYKVLRFMNEEILYNLKNVLEKISELTKQKPPPSPWEWRRGRG